MKALKEFQTPSLDTNSILTIIGCANQILNLQTPSHHDVLKIRKRLLSQSVCFKNSFAGFEVIQDSINATLNKHKIHTNEKATLATYHT